MGKVSGYDVQFQNSERRGRYVIPKNVPRLAPAHVRRIRESSLVVKEAQLFNILPIEIRNSEVTTLESIKYLLGQFLYSVPDQPTVSGFGRAAETKSAPPGSTDE